MIKLKKVILGIGGLSLLLGASIPANADSITLFPQATGIEGVINSMNVNVRNHPDTRGRIVDQAQPGEISVIGRNQEWYQVMYKGDLCWIHQDYVDVRRHDLVPYVKADGESIVEYGMEFIGTPYVWGGSNLNVGVDCSGFTQEIFGAYEIDISRVSYMQAEDGQTISKEQLACGDLVFFDTEGINDGKVSHVGIYMGEDKFLHSDGTHGVMISNLNSPYYTRNYVKSIRVVE